MHFALKTKAKTNRSPPLLAANFIIQVNLPRRCLENLLDSDPPLGWALCMGSIELNAINLLIRR